MRDRTGIDHHEPLPDVVVRATGMESIDRWKGEGP